METAAEYNEVMEGKDHITLPYLADDKLIDKLFEDSRSLN